MSEVTHAFTSAKSDGADATQVQPSHWNADHDLTDVASAADLSTLTDKVGIGASTPTTTGHVLTVTGAGTSEWATGGVSVLPDPGASWVAETAYAEGDRIMVNGLVHVVDEAGTSDVSEPGWITEEPLAVTVDGTVEWRFLGLLGQVSWVEAPEDPRMPTVQSALFDVTDHFISGFDDPSAGAGIPAGPGTIYTRDNSGTGELWVKTGAGDTAWTKVV